MKNQYSFLQEISSSPIGKILNVSSMTALGATGGQYLGNHAGTAVGNIKYKKIDPQSISWSDPEFLNIVRNSLYQAKNDVKVAREWYLSCDSADKRTAKSEYRRSLETYRDIQRDIAERNPYRWITDYKKLKIDNTANKYKQLGRVAAAVTSGLGTGLAVLKSK